MTEARNLELISASIDRQLDADDEAALKQLLESSPAARELDIDLRRLDTLLNDVPDLDPPASLHAQIMARIEPRQERQRSSIGDWLMQASLGAGFRYAMAAGAGALAAFVLLHGQSMAPTTTDMSDLVGTIAPHSAPVNSNNLDEYSFRADGAESLIKLERSNGSLYLNIEIDAQTPLDIAVDLSGAGIQPDAIAQLDSSFDAITISGQALQLRAVGRQRMTILLRRVDDTVIAEKAIIELEFSSDGRLLQQGELRPTW